MIASSGAPRWALAAAIGAALGAGLPARARAAGLQGPPSPSPSPSLSPSPTPEERAREAEREDLEGAEPAAPRPPGPPPAPTAPESKARPTVRQLLSAAKDVDDVDLGRLLAAARVPGKTDRRSGASGTEPMPFPPDVHIPLLLKVLTYDRALPGKARSEVTVAIVYAPANVRSLSVRDEAWRTLQLFAFRAIKKRPIKFLAIAHGDDSLLEKMVRDRGVSVLYIAPGNSEKLAALLRLSQARGITTVTGVPDYVRRGVAIGIGTRADREPDILVNLPGSRREGGDLDESLLRIATIVK